MHPLEIHLETERLDLLSPDLTFDIKISNYLKLNRDFFEPWMPRVPEEYYSVKKQREILKEDLDFLRQQKQFRFFIFLKDSTRSLIGDFNFSNVIKGPFQSCFLGYKLAKEENHKGYMREALKVGIDYIFNRIKLHRIEANIIPRNSSSIRLIESLGFVNEGLSKEYLEINGVWEDHFRYAKLNVNKTS